MGTPKPREPVTAQTLREVHVLPRARLGQSSVIDFLLLRECYAFPEAIELSVWLFYSVSPLECTYTT